jgi:hypothetical protein
MTEKGLQLDSGILQFAPKGAFYETQDEQFKQIYRMWEDLFLYDRTLFCLTTLLGGTGFSKGSMSHMLLSNPQSVEDGALIPQGLAIDYERNVIIHNLKRERTPRALKNLLMLTGGEGMKKVNNARTRKIILEFIFNRDHEALDNLAVNYKGKLKRLVRHALGRQTLARIIDHGDDKLFNKWIGKYHPNALPVVLYLFDRPVPANTVMAYYRKIEQVLSLKEAAIKDDVKSFEKYMKGLPYLTVMGYRNTYKVTIDKADVLEGSKMTDRQSLQMQTAAKRSGAKVKVNYNNQSIYDLWKIYYHNLMQSDTTDLPKIEKAIDEKHAKAAKIDIGPVTIVIDASESMSGSDKRPLHPFLTSLSILSVLDNIVDVIYVGGKPIDVNGNQIAVPGGATDLWRGLTEAVMTDAKKIIIISDGYENSVKGMFEHAYKHFKNSGFDFELIHINPVMSADASKGTTRQLVADVKPLPVSAPEFLETELIFNKMIENRELVKQLLVNKYQKLIGGQ